MNITTLLLATFFLGANISNAQLPDFSGTWLLQKRTSISGNDPANGMSPKIFITIKPDSIIIRKQTVDQSGNDTVYIETASFDKTSLLTISEKRVRSITLQRAVNDSQFTEIVQYENTVTQKVDRKITYTWKLSGENTLMLKRYDENLVTGEAWSMEGVYRRKSI